MNVLDELLRSLALPSATPLDDPAAFLEALALRLSAMRKGGELDIDFAGRWLIQAFRDGKLGAWTLDGLGRGGEAVDAERELEAESEGVKTSAVESVSSLSTSKLEFDGEALAEGVQRAVSTYIEEQTVPSIDALSGHQAKKQVKAVQAQARDVKRKERAVVHVKGAGIASARRRNYRR